jgi:hypothetical protein
MKSLLAKNSKSFFRLKEGETLYWRLLKLSLAWVWFKAVGTAVMLHLRPDTVTGICRYLPCDWLALPWLSPLLMIICMMLALLYVLEIRMKWTCLLMFAVSLVVFSYEQSVGIYNRTATFTALFMVQALAYIFTQDKAANRLRFSVQIIAATYTLSGLSKLTESGWRWVTDAPYLLLQMKKGAYQHYYAAGDAGFLVEKQAYVDFFTRYPGLLVFLLGTVLLAELSAVLMLTGKRMALIYGVILTGMHIGIYLFMDILIRPIAYPMCIILLNPLYRLYQAVSWIYRRGRPAAA